MQKSTVGFTLLELMVAVVIIAILVVIALPSYQRYIQRTARSNTQATMLNLAEELARHRSRNLSYSGFSPRDGYSVTSPVTTNVVVVPRGITGTTAATAAAAANKVQYNIAIVDGDSTSGAQLISAGTTLSSSNVVLGRRWAMRATPNSSNSTQASNQNILLTSDGVRCMTATNTATTEFSATPNTAGCGAGSVSW